MKVTATTTYGGSAKENRSGFGLSITAEIPESLYAVFITEGLKSFTYRGGASHVNGALGVTKNSTSTYSPERARKVEEALNTWFKNAGPNKRGTDFALPTGVEVKTVALEHSYDDTSDNRVRARAVLARWKSQGNIERKVQLYGAAAELEFDGDITNDDEVVEFIHECSLSV